MNKIINEYQVRREMDLAAAIRKDIAILSGDEIGPSDVTWQDVAGTLATNLEVLANKLHRSREGGSFGGEGFTVVCELSDMFTNPDLG